MPASQVAASWMSSPRGITTSTISSSLSMSASVALGEGALCT